MSPVAAACSGRWPVGDAGAVSRQIRLLEEYFGTALFQRQGRGLVLTLPGNAYFLQINQHLDGIRRERHAAAQCRPHGHPAALVHHVRHPLADSAAGTVSAGASGD